jgi:two-component system sensor histidine kinase PhoQ
VRIRGLGRDQGLELHLEDDGGGIPPEQLVEVLKRGHRMDQQQPGQGIGLTVASEIIGAYGGELKLGQSDLGGTDVTIIIANDRHGGDAHTHG